MSLKLFIEAWACSIFLISLAAVALIAWAVSALVRSIRCRRQGLEFEPLRRLRRR